MGADGIDLAGDPNTSSSYEQLGRYILEARIGSGGMAEGYRALRFFGDSPKKFFLKRILTAHRGNPNYVRWFLREAALVAQLNLSQIVPLVDVDEEGRFLVFELVEGCDLEHLLQSRRPERRLPMDIGVRILTETLKALAYAHARTSGGKPAGVIHRDLSPHNIMISYQGEVKVADYGVAAVIRGDGAEISTIVGKTEYRAPEETRCDEHIDGRSDIFSLGVIGYQMLSGKRPYTGTAAAIARAMAKGDRVPMRKAASDVLPELCDIIDRMLSPEPDDRYKSAAECEHDIYNVYPPDPELYKDLGQMVERAKPHRTIETAALRAYATRNASPAPHPLPAAQAPATTDEHTARTRVAPRPAAQPATEETSTTTVEGAPTVVRRARRRTQLYSALGVGLIGACILGAAAMSLTASPSGSAAPARRPHIEPPAASQSLTPPVLPTATAAEPAAAHAIEREGSAELKRTETTRAELEPAPAEPTAATGTLQVGALPQAQVWLDGEPRGWTRLVLTLPAGMYTVSIGSGHHERMATRRVVTVKAGRTTKVGF